MFPGFQTLLEYTYQIVLWCIPQILLDLCNPRQQRKICMVPSCFTSLTWLNTSANSHILRLQDSNIGPQKGLNVHTYIQVQGITTDTRFNQRQLPELGCSRYCGGEQHTVPGFVQYHGFFFCPFGTFSPNTVVDMISKHVVVPQHTRLEDL